MKSADDIKEHAWTLFLAAHTLVLERIETALAGAELPPLAWYDVLWELEKADDGKLRMHQLAERVVLSRSNLTRLADRLEDAKLLRRESCGGDRRGAYCVITAAGRQMRKKIWPVYRRQIEALFADQLTSAEARTLAQALEKILVAAKPRPQTASP